MRLYNIEEEKTKIIDVEDYSVFRTAMKNKLLPILLYVYTGFVVINLALTILSGAYVMAVINAAVHSLICVAMWLFMFSFKKTDNNVLPQNGLKMFQIAHAVKYFIVFVLIVIALILIILDWINKGNLAHQALDAAKKQTNEQVLADARHKSSIVFWSHLLTLVIALTISIVTCVYYYAVMKLADGYQKYANKGIKFFNDFKFTGIYFFVTAGVLILYSILNFLSVKMIQVDISKIELFVGTGIFSNLSRILFALFLIFAGIISLQLGKSINNVETTYQAVVDLETGETRVATEEDILEAKRKQEELQKMLADEEEKEENFVSKDLMYDEETIKNK